MERARRRSTATSPSPATASSRSGHVPLMAMRRRRAAARSTPTGGSLAPGWVDIHTHYDGQVDVGSGDRRRRAGTASTTVVMGNCGVGFAPVRPRRRGVPDRADGGRGGHPRHGPARGHRLARGSRSPSYLDALGAMPRVLDVAAQVPHAAVRAYVIGERAHEEASADEIAEMARLVARGDARPARSGFTTSRTILHRSKHGLVPGTVGTARRAARRSADAHRARPATACSSWSATSTASSPSARWHRRARAARRRAGDAHAGAGRPTRRRPAARRWPTPPSSGRRRPAGRTAGRLRGPTGMLFGLRSSLHPFITHPTYRRIADLPLAARVDAAAAARGAGAVARRGARHRQPDRDHADDALAPDLPARRPARLRAAAVGERRGGRRAAWDVAAGGRARLDARARRRGVPVRPARQLRRPATSTPCAR